jgi:hypothetical protein
MTTSINGQQAPWTIDIWEKWYTYVEVADPKLYDTHGLPVSANWMPGGPTSPCFAFTLPSGRTFHQMLPR